MQHWALNTVVIVENKHQAKALKQMILILPGDMILSMLTSAALQRRRARVRSLPTRTAVRLLLLNADIWPCWRFAHLQLARTTRFPFHADGNQHSALLPTPVLCPSWFQTDSQHNKEGLRDHVLARFVFWRSGCGDIWGNARVSAQKSELPIYIS